MSRNAEKAQSMLFRFREAQAAELGVMDASRHRRPRDITQVDSIPVCERWRGQALKEISRKVSQIQDPALSEYQIRDLNDDINKLMREKHMWEVQIRNLGGPNYLRLASGKLFDEAGREIPGGGRGYRYFGRAKELPGVKELFEAAKTDSSAKAGSGEDSAWDARRLVVDAAYYGYAPDEEDEELLRHEALHEATLRQKPWQPPPASDKRRRPRAADDNNNSEAEDWEPLPGDAGDGRGPWNLPTLEQVQQELLDRRKRRLLEQI